MFRISAAALLALAGLQRASFAAEGEELKKAFGRGVHAYHAGRYVEAHEELNGAIEAGSRDPRCYYFRGLACMKLGRQAEAEEDFKQGSEFEATSSSGFFNISKSLERIQGKARMALEKHRSQARLLAHRRLEDERARRYRGMVEAEADVLLRPLPAQPPQSPSGQPQQAAGVSDSRPNEPPEEESEDPFSEKPGEGGADEASGADAATDDNGEPENGEPENGEAENGEMENGEMEAAEEEEPASESGTEDEDSSEEDADSEDDPAEDEDTGE